MARYRFPARRLLRVNGDVNRHAAREATYFAGFPKAKV